MRNVKTFGCSLDLKMFEKLEEERGLIPRSAYISMVLSEHLEKKD